LQELILALQSGSYFRQLQEVFRNPLISGGNGLAKKKSARQPIVKKGDSKLVAEDTEIINSILTKNPDESILIWNYIADGNRSIAKAIKKRLKVLYPSIDLDAANEKDDKILNFNTFGNELGLNSFTHCKHSIFCGLLYLPRAYLAGMLKGLSKDINRKVFEKNLLDNKVVSEQAHTFYQAVSRGFSQLTEDGICKEHNIYFFHPKPLALKRMLANVFPCDKWKRYKAVHIDNNCIEIQLESIVSIYFFNKYFKK
jgi:hypothetical protein